MVNLFMNWEWPHSTWEWLGLGLDPLSRREWRNGNGRMKDERRIGGD
jgi:hypothetical protein